MLSCSIEPPPQYGQYLALLLVDIPITWNFILQLLHTNVVAIIMYRKVLSTLYYMHASRCQQNLLICSLLSHSHSTNKVKYDSTCIIYDEGSLCNNATSSQVHATFCNDCVRTSPTISYVIGIISICIDISHFYNLCQFSDSSFGTAAAPIKSYPSSYSCK
jgi:hypothetical protein